MNEMRNKLSGLLSLLLFLCGVELAAQEPGEGIRFVEGVSFEEALGMAKKEGKLLFVDCYTGWCGPCKKMASVVFVQKEVGDFFNAEFVSLKVDMEKGEGPDLRKRFAVKAYPTFLFLDGDGNEVHRLVGSADADEFLRVVKDGVGVNSLSTLRKRYEAGERETGFLLTYLSVLEGAYVKEETEMVANALLEGREAEMLENEELYNAFLKYNTSPLSAPCTYVLDHKEQFEARYDKAKLDARLNGWWMAYPYTLVTKDGDGHVVYDEAAMKRYVKLMKERKVADCAQIVLNTDIHVAEVRGEWAQYAKLCTKYMKKYEATDMVLYNWVLRILDGTKDRKVRDTAIGWLEKRIKALDEEEANLPPLKEGEIRAMPMMDFRQYFRKQMDELRQ